MYRISYMTGFEGKPGRPDVSMRHGAPGVMQRALPATPEQLLQISENWKPYRTWVTLLMRTQLEFQTGEITGRGPHAGRVKLGLARGCV